MIRLYLMHFLPGWKIPNQYSEFEITFYNRDIKFQKLGSFSFAPCKLIWAVYKRRASKKTSVWLLLEHIVIIKC